MKILFLTLLVILMSGCSTSEKKRINDEVNQETGITDGRSLHKSVHEAIQKSTTLTDEKKSSLESLLNDLGAKNKPLSEESFKYRGVLMKELISGKASEKQIRLIEKQIAKIERERLKNTIKTAREMARIVSGEKEQTQILEQIIMFRDR